MGSAGDDDELLRSACLGYGDDDRGRLATGRALLAADPGLARASVWAAAAAADVDALRGFVAADPDAAGRAGGPLGWEPLLYLTYSRLGVGDPVAAAAVLLDAGADPEAGFLWDGHWPPFTAVTGALGGGEDLQPEHPAGLALAQLLLERGADANDDQAVYNRGLGGSLGPDAAWLELLLEFGLGRGEGGAWRRRPDADLPAPADLLQEALQAAVEHGRLACVDALLRAGADPNGRGLHPTFAGRTAVQGAVRHGHAAVRDRLVAAGGDLSSVVPIDRAVGALLAGEPVADPDVLAAARAAAPGLISRAVELGRSHLVPGLVERGWDVGHRARTTALHQAAWRGDLPAIRLLLDLGADPTVEDEEFHATPKGWALHNDQQAAAALL